MNSSAAQLAPAAGWYHDPESPDRYRWWDGDAWTEHSREPEAQVDSESSPEPVELKAATFTISKPAPSAPEEFTAPIVQEELTLEDELELEVANQAAVKHWRRGQIETLFALMVLSVASVAALMLYFSQIS